MKRKCKMLLGKLVWDLGEYFGFNFGRYSHVVFSWMVGIKGKEINK